MSKTLVSVIIPAYNHEKYVQETIKSIINQTYQNIELIVIDDGSKDFTWQKILEMKDECERRFEKVHFETKQNEGTCKTLNKLLSCAQGDFIYLIASDDLAKPQAIEKEVEFLSKHKDFALCVGDNEIIDFESKVCYWDKFRNIEYNKNKAYFKTFAEFLHKLVKFDFKSDKFGRYDKVLLDNHIPNGYMIRRSIFEKIGYFTPEAPLEDWWLMLQLSKYAKMKYLNEILFSYRWHSANTIKQSEKLEGFGNRTQKYEMEILNNLDMNSLPTTNRKIVEKVKSEGICMSSIGVPHVFTFEKYKCFSNKIRKIKIFNFTVLKWKK